MAAITIRELVTKLKSVADLSGFKKQIGALKETARASRKEGQKERASTAKTSKYKTTKAVETMKTKLKLMRETFKVKRLLDRKSLKETRSRHKSELSSLKATNREKIKQMRKIARTRRRTSKRSRGGGVSLGGGGGGGIGVGSIVSGNVIANAVTSGFRTAARAVQTFVSDMIGAAADIEKVQAEFGVMLGSGDRALGLIAELKKKGAETPLQFKDLAKNARILLQYGSSAENVVEQLTMIGDVVGGDKARFDFMSFAFAQMRSAGKLMGQELRQMVNAGFNPLEQMMKTTGLTMNQLRKEMEMGTISSDMVTEAFKQATSQGGRFFNNMAVQAKTFSGRVSTMRDELFMMMEAMGTRLLPGMKKSVDAIITFIKGPGRKIGVNLMDAILPAINAVISGMERFVRVVFQIDKIGAFLKNKDELGTFFQNLAVKIDDAFLFITAAALKLKDFFNEIKGPVGEAFVIIVWGIKEVLKNLPLFIKLWAGIKLASVMKNIMGLATAIGLAAKAMLGFAIANPALAATTALLVGMGLAVKSIFDAIEHNEKVDQFNKDTKKDKEDILALDKKVADQRKAVLTLDQESKDAGGDATVAGRRIYDEALAEDAKLGSLIDKRDSAMKALQDKRDATFSSTGGSGLLDQISGLFSGMLGGGAGGTTGKSFDKILADIKKTQVTQNFFTKLTVDTTIEQKIPQGTDSTSVAKETAKLLKRNFGVSLNEQFQNMRIATAS